MSGDLLGAFVAREGPWGEVGFGLALAAALALQRLQIALGRREEARWWASNGRDAANALSLALLMGTLMGMGFSGPLALVWSAALLGWMSSVSEVFTRARFGSSLVGRWPIGALGALSGAVPLMAAPTSCAALLNRLAAHLFA